MPDHSNLSLDINLEFLRKEAKALLKRCRSRDASTLRRIRAGNPRVASFDDQRVAAEVRLADVQHVLAREHGYVNWAELKRLDTQRHSAPDYSRPVLPDISGTWRLGISYTVRPEILSPLPAREEYRICVSVLRKVQNADAFDGYKELYARTAAIAHARAARLTGLDEETRPHKRILTQGWFRHGATNLVRAFLTLGISYLGESDSKPQGEVAPLPEELSRPGGMTPDNTTATSALKPFHEAYAEADVRDESSATDVACISYGEYVENCTDLNYQPFVERAEQLAAFHAGLFKQKMKIIRREWFCATNPNIAVVHVYSRMEAL
jgi:hypothetical protein